MDSNPRDDGSTGQTDPNEFEKFLDSVDTGGPDSDSRVDTSRETGPDVGTEGRTSEAADTDSPGGFIPKATYDLFTGREESSIFATIKPERRDEFGLGTYVTIPIRTVSTETRRLLASVERVNYVPYSGSDTLIPRSYEENPLSENEFTQLVELDPISIVTGDSPSNYQSQPVSRPPRPGQPVEVTTEKPVLSTGLNIPETGVFTGWMSINGERIPTDESPLPYQIYNPTVGDPQSGEPALFRHIQLGGSTGKGKTHFAKNLIRQFASGLTYEVDVATNTKTDSDTLHRELGTVVLDAENEYVEMRDNPDPSLSNEFKSKIEREDISYGGIGAEDCPADFNILVPETQNTTPELFGGETRFGIPFSAVNGQTELLVSDEANGPTYNEIQKLLSAFFTTKPEGMQTYEEFQGFLEGQLELIDSDSIRGAVRRRVSSSYAANVFSCGDTHQNSFTDMAKRQIGPGTVTVIPTGHLSGREEKTVISAILSTIIQNKIQSGNTIAQIANTPLLLVLDEAHEYLSEPETVQERYILEQYTRAAKRGRKDMLGLFNITQNPDDIHPEISQQTNTRIYLGLEPGVVDSNNVYVPEKFAGQITNFKKGQAVIKQPDISPVEITGLRHCLTKHTN